MYSQDFESYGFDDLTRMTTDLSGNYRYTVVRDSRYEGLNRAQRRKAMAVESRAERKRNKRRG
jgi:hypothetical protein